MTSPHFHHIGFRCNGKFEVDIFDEIKMVEIVDLKIVKSTKDSRLSSIVKDSRNFMVYTDYILSPRMQ